MACRCDAMECRNGCSKRTLFDISSPTSSSFSIRKIGVSSSCMSWIFLQFAFRILFIAIPLPSAYCSQGYPPHPSTLALIPTMSDEPAPKKVKVRVQYISPSHKSTISVWRRSFEIHSSQCIFIRSHIYMGCAMRNELIVLNNGL